MNNWGLSSECEFYSQDFGDNCHNSSLCMHMHNARSLSYVTPSHTGSLKEVKSFTLAASASTNIEKVQEIGTLCLLRAAFGARGCKQIDLLKLSFDHLIPLLRNLPPPHYLINLVSAPSSAIQVSSFYLFSNSCPKCSLASKKTAISSQYTLFMPCLCSSGSKIPFPHPCFYCVHAYWKEFSFFFFFF